MDAPNTLWKYANTKLSFNWATSGHTSSVPSSCPVSSSRPSGDRAIAVSHWGCGGDRHTTSPLRPSVTMIRIPPVIIPERGATAGDQQPPRRGVPKDDGVAVLGFLVPGRVSVDRPELTIGDRAGVDDAVAVGQRDGEAVRGEGQRVAPRRGTRAWMAAAGRRGDAADRLDPPARRTNRRCGSRRRRGLRRQRPRPISATVRETGWRRLRPVSRFQLATSPLLADGDQRLSVGVPRDEPGGRSQGVS